MQAVVPSCYTHKKTKQVRESHSLRKEAAVVWWYYCITCQTAAGWTVCSCLLGSFVTWYFSVSSYILDEEKTCFFCAELTCNILTWAAWSRVPPCECRRPPGWRWRGLWTPQSPSSLHSLFPLQTPEVRKKHLKKKVTNLLPQEVIFINCVCWCFKGLKIKFLDLLATWLWLDWRKSHFGQICLYMLYAGFEPKCQQPRLTELCRIK